MEGGATAHLAFHLNLAGMFLDDAVTSPQDPSPVPRRWPSTGRALGCKKWVIDTLYMCSERDARSGVREIDTPTCPFTSVATRSVPPAGHRVLRIQE